MGDAAQLLLLIFFIFIFVGIPMIFIHENNKKDIKKQIDIQRAYKEKQKTETLKREAQELIDAAERLEKIRKNGLRNTVYAVYDKISYRIYIGKTSDYNFRMSQHFDEEYRYSQKNKKLYIEMEKLGENNFEHIILATNLQANYATYLEAKLIRANNSDTKGYNQKNESENLWYGPKLKVENPKAYQRFEELCKLDISSEIKNGTFKTIVLDK